MNIQERIDCIRRRIQDAETGCNQKSGHVTLLAVSKGQSAMSIKEAYEAGLRDFGENYWQEAENKIRALSALPIRWHFIGPIQGNKAKKIAQKCTWVHSVSRHAIAHKLSEARPDSLPPLNICLQINFDKEESKAGVSPDEVEKLAFAVQAMPRLRLRGLMVIPKKQTSEKQQYLSFLRLTKLLEDLNAKQNLSLDTLSMGMSDDLKAAICAGSTMVRIGRAIFGERT